MISSAPASERCVPSSLYVESPNSPLDASQSSLLNASTMLLACAANSAMVCLHLFGGPSERPISSGGHSFSKGAPPARRKETRCAITRVALAGRLLSAGVCLDPDFSLRHVDVPGAQTWIGFTHE